MKYFYSVTDRWLGTSKYVRFSMMSSLLQAVVISILEFIVYSLHEKQLLAYGNSPPANDRALSVYYILFIISQIFQLILCLDATYNKNTIQVIALAVFNFLSLGYSILQHIQAQNIISSDEFKAVASVYQNYHVSQNLEFAIIALMLLFSLSFAYQAYQLYQEYGWSIYKKIGADLRMRSMYKVYQILLMLLKLDVFFLLGFSVQYLMLVIANAESSKNELVIHVAVSLCGTVSMMILSFWALRAENRFGIIVFMLACLMTIGYLVYKLVIMYTVEGSISSTCKNGKLEFKLPDCDRFAGSRYFLTFFVVVCLLLLFATILETYKALRNFGQGLKQHINRTAVNWNGALNLESPEAQKRWSID